MALHDRSDPRGFVGIGRAPSPRPTPQKGRGRPVISFAPGQHTQRLLSGAPRPHGERSAAGRVRGQRLRAQQERQMRSPPCGPLKANFSSPHPNRPSRATVPEAIPTGTDSLPPFSPERVAPRSTTLGHGPKPTTSSPRTAVAVYRGLAKTSAGRSSAERARTASASARNAANSLVFDSDRLLCVPSQRTARS